MLLFFSCATKDQSQVSAPYALTLSEGFENPLGFYDAKPSFSWKLPIGVASQRAYSIVVASDPELLPDNPDLWQSQKVESDQSIYISYKGPSLLSRQKVYWQVKYWDENMKASAWSEVANFELGLLTNKDWEAKWISLPNQKAIEITGTKFKSFKVQYIRKAIQINSDVEKARLYISAKGLFEASLNGKCVGNDVLTPGWTPYESRIETLTYDVGALLTMGSNVVGLKLAEGWYSGRLLFRAKNEEIPRVIAQLEVEYKNGERQIYSTDQTWKATNDGPIQYASIYDGEFYNATHEITGWDSADFDDSQWLPVEEESISNEVQLSPKRHNPIIEKITLPTLKITEPTEGSFVFDLGQNMAGVPKLNMPVKKGQLVKIRFAEMLQANGEIYTENYRSAISTDYYLPSKDGVIEWQPTFTFHGFRYVELSGFDQSVVPEKSWVSGLVQYSDFEMNGNFKSSHEKLNQLQSNIEWGLRGNFLDIPTDCPQRDERLGWTGDAQVFIPTSFFIGDVHSFWSSWMQSIREDQKEDGAIPVVIPDVGFDRVSSGWGDAVTVVPWETYYRTGDISILEDSYPSMRKWLNYYASKSENHIVDMFTFGDWLQPFSTNGNKGSTSEKLINTAYYARSIQLTMKTAEVLGLKEEEVELNSLWSEVRTAFQNNFFNKDGSISQGSSTQTAYLLAIGFELLTPDMKEKAIPYLLHEIEIADHHLRTGFLGTPLLAPVLEEIGRSDLMFGMLFKETYPSWFYSINQGATTMWERWNSYTLDEGFNSAGMNSFNHYAYGAIGQWMYERIAGIQPATPGYKEILIAPLPGGPLTSAQVTYSSPYGEISSSWQIIDDVFKLNTTIPPNTTAKIVIPRVNIKSLLLNGNEFVDSNEIKLLKKGENTIELKAQPGTYWFESKWE